MHRTHDPFNANPIHSIFHSFHAERSEHWNGLEWDGIVRVKIKIKIKDKESLFNVAYNEQTKS